MTDATPIDRIDLAERLEADSGSLQGLLEWHTSHVHFYEEQSDEERAGFHRNMCDWLSSTVASCSQAASTIRSLSKALEEAREGLAPYAKAFAETEERYRKRGGAPERLRDDAPWFSVTPSLLVRGKETVPPELAQMTKTGAGRRAALALSNIEKTLKGEQP